MQNRSDSKNSVQKSLKENVQKNYFSKKKTIRSDVKQALSNIRNNSSGHQITIIIFAIFLFCLFRCWLTLSYHISRQTGKWNSARIPQFQSIDRYRARRYKTRVARYLRILSLKKKSNISFLVYLQTSPYFNVFQNNKQCIYNDKNKWENHPEWHFLHETRRNSWKMKTTTKKKIWHHFFDK